MERTTLAIATDHFEVDPAELSYAGSDVLSFLLDAFESMGHEPLEELIGESWGASCRVRIGDAPFDVSVAVVEPESEPPRFLAFVTVPVLRALGNWVRRKRSTIPAAVSDALEDAVCAIPAVRDVRWRDPHADGSPTFF